MTNYHNSINDATGEAPTGGNKNTNNNLKREEDEIYVPLTSRTHRELKKNGQNFTLDEPTIEGHFE